MNYIYNIVKIANKILVAESEKDYKKYLRQKIKKENPNLEQLQLSTEVGKINQEVKEKLRKIKPNYHQYVYKWLIQDQLPEDIDSKFVTYLEQYQYIKNNNKENILIPNNVLDSFANLYTFIQNYNKQHQPLNISVEKQKVRKQPLPFKHISSNGSYNMYIIQENQYQDLNRLYGNNNGSEYGGLIATTSWCVALRERYFDGYQSPYYLITEGKTSPEALVHIDSHQFKKIDDTSYDKNHQEVYQLVYCLLKSKNKISFNGDFIQLFDHVQNKDQIINDLINNRDFNSIYNLICHDKIKDEKVLEKAIKAFIDNNECDKLYNLIRLNAIKDEKQVEKVIQNFIDNNRFSDLWDLIRQKQIKDEKQVEKAIQKLIDNNKFCHLYYLICYDKIKDEEQVKNSIRKMIDNNQFNYLGDLIYRNKIKDEEQFKDAIQKFIDYNEFSYLRDLIYFNKIKDEKLIRMIENAKNNVNVKTSSIAKKLLYISEILR